MGLVEMKRKDTSLQRDASFDLFYQVPSVSARLKSGGMCECPLVPHGEGTAVCIRKN